MSIVTKFVSGGRVLSQHKSSGPCEFQVVIADNGSRLLQLSTFGSDKRKDKGTVAQTIQLDRSRAEELIKILRSTFGL